MEPFAFETIVALSAADAVSDAAVKPLLRLRLLSRGTKRLSSSVKLAGERLEKLKGAQPPFEGFPDYRPDNILRVRRLGAARCLTFSPRWISCRKHVIYFCGGDFINDPTYQHLSFVDALAADARAELTVLALPNAPTYTYADTYEAAAALYSSLAAEKGAENIILAGDSSGAAVALALCGFFKHAGLPKPGGVAVFSPLCDLTFSNPQLEGAVGADPVHGIPGLAELVRAWCGFRRPGDALLNPMDMDASALPPLLIFTGTDDIFYPDVRLFASHVHSCGGTVDLRIYKGMYHGFQLHRLKASKHALNALVEWLNL